MLSSLRAPVMRAARAAPIFRRGFAADTDSHEYTFATPAIGHNLPDAGPAATTTATRAEMDSYLETMLRMRRMEIAFDNEYKARNIRGFCHLYDGQEAINIGIEAAASRKDSVVTSYRDHTWQVTRGEPMKNVLGELLGRYCGPAKGKGGSMHMYKKENNFFGGNGIVGAQVPVGAGLAFAHKYKGDGGVTFTLYGDGAANQGQICETANMAALWKLPMVYVVENNQFGMGTSTKRSSALDEYYKRGHYMPGLKVDVSTQASCRSL